MGWSGDVAQLALEQPDLRFVVPESGGMLWADVMVMPKGARHRREVAQWLNWVYDPSEAARIAAAVQYISPVEGVQQVLANDPATAALARNPLMFPDASQQQRLHMASHLPPAAASTQRPLLQAPAPPALAASPPRQPGPLWSCPHPL